MPQAERLFHICRRLNQGDRVSVRSLMDELEVSRATIFRDIELVRDRLRTPVVWDAEDGSYRLEPQQGPNARYALPGLWLEADQLYGMLTVLNIAAAVDPGVAGHYRKEFAKALKQAMARHDIPGYGLDRKISVELPRPPAAAQKAMRVIGPALMLAAPIRLWATRLAPEGEIVIPTELRLTAAGWILEARRPDLPGGQSIALADIARAEPAAPGKPPD